MALVDRRKARMEWHVTDEAGNLYTSMRDGVTVAVLMDIRDELQRLNGLLNCRNFTGIPGTLRAIRRNTTKRKYTKKTKEQE